MQPVTEALAPGREAGIRQFKGMLTISFGRDPDISLLGRSTLRAVNTW